VLQQSSTKHQVSRWLGRHDLHNHPLDDCCSYGRRNPGFFGGIVQEFENDSITLEKSAPEDTDTEDWPLRKLQEGLVRYTEYPDAAIEYPKGTAVILTTGGMNPSHRGHVQLLHQARERLERDGYGVVGMWLSVSHDGYLQPKAQALGTVGLSASFRLHLARESVVDDPLVAVGAWEARKAGRWPDFISVTAALEDVLNDLYEVGQIQELPMVFYACGTDHAEKGKLYGGMGEGRGVVVVPRSSEVAQQERPDKLVLIAEPCVGEVASFSSTKVREAIAAKNSVYCTKSMSSKAAQFLLAPTLDEYNDFKSDFDLLNLQVV